jgi:hypothetical protein
VLPGLLLALGGIKIKISPDPALNYISYRRILDDCERLKRRILLVFGNVADVRQISGLIPERGSHRVLITSRNALAARIPGAQSFTVQPLVSFSRSS